MPLINRALLTLKRIAIVVGIAFAFSLGLLSAIYLSLRSSETKVPDIVGKDRASAENTISDAGLNFRVRATRATSEAKPDTVLIQLPRAGEIVKVGQTVAVDISGPTRGDTSPPETANSNTNSSNESNQVNINTSSNANDNKPKRRPANKNANDNENGNTNRVANRNRNTNSNSASTGEGYLTSPPNVNRSRENVNTGGNNTNRRPIPAPTP